MLQDLDGLVARRHGPHVVVCRHDEPTPALHDAGMPGRLFVLVTPAAKELLGGTLPGSLLPAGPLTEIWLGADESLAAGLSEEFGVPVFTPRGGFMAEPGAAMFAEGGWRSGETVHFRFPVPAWESVLRGEQVTGDGVVAWQIPAGLIVRTVGQPVEESLAVPVDYRFPKIVVGTGVSAGEVAELLGRLPLGPFLVVPGTDEVSTCDWQSTLAGLLERDIVFSTGMQRPGARTVVAGEVPYRPFATVLRQPWTSDTQEVLDIAAAPPGWTRAGERHYQRGVVRAEVMPGGLVLTSRRSAPADSQAFDPAGWTLTVGGEGELVGLPLLEAAERLLDGLDPAQRAVVRVRLGGDLDERGREALGRAGARPARVEPVAEPAVVPDVVAEPVALVVEAAPAEPVLVEIELAEPLPAVEPMSVVPEPLPTVEPMAADPEVAAVPVEPEVVVEPEPVLPDLSFAPPSIMTMSGAPVSTVSSPPEPAEAELPEHPEPELPVAEEPEPEPEPVEPEVLVVEEVPEPVVEQGPLIVPDRPSTAAEQTRFTAAAGEVFGEALATVNSALATWPSMRYSGEAELKADYVAVCLYLGRGEAGTAELNEALRAGQPGGVDALVPCLVSGIRRLPTHRRAVLRQGKLGEAIEHRSAPGTVLTEPGFLTASIDLAVTVPDADLDVLIWPCSARRTSDLLTNRPVDEAIFVAGARFKALAIRTADDEEPPEEDVPLAPKIAVLFRELAPGETPAGDELDDRDLAVLAKLDRVLARRRGAELRLVDDPDLITRLSTSMLEWHESATVTAAAS